MAVGFKVGTLYFPVGGGDFLHSFFSTVAFHLEKKQWGKKYPYIMKELYQGRLTGAQSGKALKELFDIKKKLSRLSPDAIVWDMDDLSKQPPWGRNIAPTITCLADYFVTNEGEDFISVLEKALAASQQMSTDIFIQ